jgi:hypothetical protein
MALELRIDIQANKDSITFFEQTCKYNNPDNLTGWGVPNPIIADALSATLNITQPNSDSVTDVIDLSLYYPSQDGLGYKIFQTSLDDLGGNGVIQDGVWTFNYVVVINLGEGNTETYETTCRFLLDANSQCCISERVTRLNVKSCDNAYDDQTFYMIMIYEAAKAAMCSGEYDRAQDLMDEVNRLCDCCCS